MVCVGVDACRRGWVAVALGPGTAVRGEFVGTLADLPARVPDAEGFAVDIPIGLPRAGRRRADVEARALLGPRRNSVFFTPVRAALEAPSHRRATEVAQRLTGQGISQQAYALRGKILDAERWFADAPAPVWEVHPEVSFAVLLGRPARWPKKTWDGTVERLEALRSVGIELGALGTAGQLAGADDVLDAAVAAWSAQRLVRGQGVSLPDPPETDPGSSRPVAIWA